MLGGDAARWRLGSGTRSYERARARMGLVTCCLGIGRRLDGGLDLGEKLGTLEGVFIRPRESRNGE